MKRILIVCLVSLSIVGCMSEEDKSNSADDIISSIYYFKDYNTDLCFAGKGGSHYNSFSFTIVPCNEKVERLLKNNNKYYTK